MRRLASSICMILFPCFNAAAIDVTVQSLDTARADYAKAMMGEAVQPIVSLYGEQSRLMPEYQETAIGQGPVRDYLQAYFSRFDIRLLEKSSVELLDLGAMIVGIGTFDVEQIERSTDQMHIWSGVYFDVWARGAADQLTLVSQSWNYDEPYDGLRGLVHFDLASSTPAQQIPGLVIEDERMYEIKALREMGRRSMMTGQSNLVSMIYADDAMYAPHDAPMVRGKPEIREHLAAYTKNWPSFSFVDTSTDRIDFLGQYAVEHMSYNLRWIGGDQTGVGTGKGVRVWKRSEDGLFQSYRQIAMHDF